MNIAIKWHCHDNDSTFIVNPCFAQPEFILFCENSVDPVQMASDEAI